MRPSTGRRDNSPFLNHLVGVGEIRNESKVDCDVYPGVICLRLCLWDSLQTGPTPGVTQALFHPGLGPRVRVPRETLG